MFLQNRTGKICLASLNCVVLGLKSNTALKCFLKSFKEGFKKVENNSVSETFTSVISKFS